MSKDKTLCSAFWNHTNIRGGDRIFPCCRFKKPIAQFNGDLEQVLTIPEYQELRQKSLNGEFISECQKCYMEETLGKKSLRQEFNETYDTEVVELKYLEIGFDNICNLTCDGCWGEFSSAWANIENPNNTNKENVIQVSELTSVPNTITRITFLGGEPLMTNRHVKFLKTFADTSELELTYYTNGTFLLTNDAIEILSRVSKVTFILSIDGIGELNNKVRSGSRWTDILAFIQQIKNLNFNLSVHSVLHTNNWSGFEDLSLFVKSIESPWTLGVLTYPDRLSVANLTEQDRDDFISRLDNFFIPNKDFVINFLKNENRSNRKIYKLEQA